MNVRLFAGKHAPSSWLFVGENALKWLVADLIDSQLDSVIDSQLDSVEVNASKPFLREVYEHSI